MVFYGASGTGKSTVLNIIQMLFEGYWCVFDAKALGSASSSFALEPFRNNPLVAIQHDGDLSRIEDNTRLNSLVSHEHMTINEKFTNSINDKILEDEEELKKISNSLSKKEINKLVKKEVKKQIKAITKECKKNKRR